MSAANSRSPSWTSGLKSAIGCPPRRWIATSKDTRVRLLGRWKMSASERPASGLPRSRPDLAAVGQVEDGDDLVGAEVRDAEQIATGER